MANTNQKITIDGVEYALNDLSNDAKNQLMNLRVTDQEIARLQTQLAIAQTARTAYAHALSAALPQGGAAAAQTTQAAGKKASNKKA